MGNYVLILHHERCPDGAEFAPHPWVHGNKVKFPSKPEYLKVDDMEYPTWEDYCKAVPTIRFRSKRKESYRLRLETPDKLIVTDYLNDTAPVLHSPLLDAEYINPNIPLGRLGCEETGLDCDYSGLIKFVSDYGFPREHVGVIQAFEGRYKTPSPREPSQPLGSFINDREWMHKIWSAYESGDVQKAADLFRVITGGSGGHLSPDLEFRNGKLSLMLPILTLYDFMLMETALVLTGGSQVSRCSECSTIFVTGSGTGRRGTSRYCSNRCRVAAQRSRKSTPASSTEDLMTDEEKLEKIAEGVRRTLRE
jgi:hypothetical protein